MWTHYYLPFRLRAMASVTDSDISLTRKERKKGRHHNKEKKTNKLKKIQTCLTTCKLNYLEIAMFVGQNQVNIGSIIWFNLI